MGSSTSSAIPSLSKAEEAVSEQATYPESSLSASWRSDNDIPTRKLMMKQLLRIFLLRFPEDLRKKLAPKVPRLLREVESTLYQRAASLEEYRNAHTLWRRLQYLVLEAYHTVKSQSDKHEDAFVQTKAEERDTDEGDRLRGGWRRLSRTREQDHILARRRKISFSFSPSSLSPSRESCCLRSSKRQKLEQTGEDCLRSRSKGIEGFWLEKGESTALTQGTEEEEAEETSFVIGYNEMLTAHIYSFLEGKEAIKHRAVNRFASRVLPNCVVTLSLSVSCLQRALKQQREGDLATAACTFLSKYSSLESLTIYGPSSESESPRTGEKRNSALPSVLASAALARVLESPASSHSSSTSSPTSPTSADALHSTGRASRETLQKGKAGRGEGLVKCLGFALGRGACPKLKKLRFQAAFVNTSRLDGMRYLIEGLLQGKTPLLQSLSLNNDSIGDRGVYHLSSLLLSSACPRLQSIDLRHNYIGEAGAVAVAEALQTRASVRELRMDSNILCDKSALLICDALLASRCSTVDRRDSEGLRAGGKRGFACGWKARERSTRADHTYSSIYSLCGRRNAAPRGSRSDSLFILSFEDNFISEEGIEKVKDKLRTTGLRIIHTRDRISLPPSAPVHNSA